MCVLGLIVLKWKFVVIVPILRLVLKMKLDECLTEFLFYMFQKFFYFINEKNFF